MARFARQIAGQGYICAAPSSYHEFTGPEALKYDAEDTDKGNTWKISKVRIYFSFHLKLVACMSILVDFDILIFIISSEITSI